MAELDYHNYLIVSKRKLTQNQNRFIISEDFKLPDLEMSDTSLKRYNFVCVCGNLV